MNYVYFCELEFKINKKITFWECNCGVQIPLFEFQKTARTRSGLCFGAYLFSSPPPSQETHCLGLRDMDGEDVFVRSFCSFILHVIYKVSFLMLPPTAAGTQVGRRERKSLTRQTVCDREKTRSFPSNSKHNHMTHYNWITFFFVFNYENWMNEFESYKHF